MNRVLWLVVMVFWAMPAMPSDLTTYRCSYDRYTEGDKIKKVEKPFELIFITDKGGKVTLVGNQGSSEVIGVWNKAQEGVSFLEVTGIGNVMTTVVDTKGASVHSRHTIIRGAVVPSQYYGKCQIQ